MNFKTSLIEFIKLLIPPILYPTMSGFKKMNDIFFSLYGNFKFSKTIQYEKDAHLNRIAYITKAVSKFENEKCKYLEIGVDDNKVFNVVPVLKKFGVDPVRGGNYRKTSDDFFKDNTESFDVIFIDGLHIYKQCQKDFKNALKCLNDNGIIILHDLIPQDYIDEYVPQKTFYRSWTGDVWKVAVEISKSKNLEFCIANCDKGIGLVKKKDNYVYNEMPELESKRFPDFYKNYYNNLPIVSSKKALKFLD